VRAKDVSLATTVGSVSLANCVLTASGTAGHGAELADYGDLRDLGGIVTKSLSAFAWDGNAAPRVAPAGVSMINAVGLAGPGVDAWRSHGLVELRSHGATVVGSIWGRTAEEFADAARAMQGADIAALEINASCPNLEARNAIFANSPEATAELVKVSRVAGVPLWVKLTLTAPNIIEVASAALEAGAEALVIGNTLTGMVIDIESGRPVLGNGGGGVSGSPLHPIATRAIFDVRRALPDAPILGVGGVSSGRDAVAFFMAGANAVEIGTAGLANPRAPWRIQRELRRWMAQHNYATLNEIRGRAHG